MKIYFKPKSPNDYTKNSQFFHHNTKKKPTNVRQQVTKVRNVSASTPSTLTSEVVGGKREPRWFCHRITQHSHGVISLKVATRVYVFIMRERNLSAGRRTKVDEPTCIRVQSGPYCGSVMGRRLWVFVVLFCVGCVFFRVLSMDLLGWFRRLLWLDCLFV